MSAYLGFEDGNYLGAGYLENQYTFGEPYTEETPLIRSSKKDKAVQSVGTGIIQSIGNAFSSCFKCCFSAKQEEDEEEEEDFHSIRGSFSSLRSSPERPNGASSPEEDNRSICSSDSFQSAVTHLTEDGASSNPLATQNPEITQNLSRSGSFSSISDTSDDGQGVYDPTPTDSGFQSGGACAAPLTREVEAVSGALQSQSVEVMRRQILDSASQLHVILKEVKTDEKAGDLGKVALDALLPPASMIESIQYHEESKEYRFKLKRPLAAKVTIDKEKEAQLKALRLDTIESQIVGLIGKGEIKILSPHFSLRFEEQDGEKTAAYIGKNEMQIDITFSGWKDTILKKAAGAATGIDLSQPIQVKKLGVVNAKGTKKIGLFGDFDYPTRFSGLDFRPEVFNIIFQGFDWIEA